MSRTMTGLERALLLSIVCSKFFQKAKRFHCLIIRYDGDRETCMDHHVFPHLDLRGQKEAYRGLNSAHVHPAGISIDLLH